MNMFDLSVVIVNFNTPQLTTDCIKSVKKFTKNIKFEIILIDNSKDNKGFTGGNNVGMKRAKGRYILLLNSDTLIHDNVLGEMVKWLDTNPKIGIASCALKNNDGSLQATGGYFPTLPRIFSWMLIQDIPFIDGMSTQFHPKSDYFYKKLQSLDWITGAFMMIRKVVVDQIGFLDEDYFMYTEDTDFCYRAKERSFSIIYNPKWSITHFGGASSQKEFPILSEFKNVKLFYKKHYPRWQYPVLRFLLKLGSLWRILLISPKIYGDAFKKI